MGNLFASAGLPQMFVHPGAVELEVSKAKTQIIIEIIEYIPHVVISKTVINKSKDNITVSSFLDGEELIEKISPFDTYIQIIDGIAELGINNRDYILHMGDGIIIPANTKHYFNAHVKFKMLCTIVRTDCE